MRIATKAEFLELSAAGRLGNTMPSWDTTGDAQADGYHGPVMIRDRTPGSPFMRGDVEQADVPLVMHDLAMQGADFSRLYLTHMTPGAGRVLNAEVWDGPGGPYVHYSTEQAHLRAALDRSGRHAEGALARAVLRHCLDPDSYDDLFDLLEQYPGHCVELTAYDRPIGHLAHTGRRTIFWEVRLY